jgi:hypothetical protein
MKNFGLVLLTAACLSWGMGCATTTRTSTRGATTAPSGPVTAATTEPGVIPAGTTFAIRTNEQITSEQSGKTYSAQVEQDIMDQSGRLLVPKGSPAQLVVVETSSGGVTTPTMELAIRSVSVNGRSYPIATGSVQQEGEQGLGANRRTAEMVGGGALLGTLLGAAVGGGKGAAVGAAVGAAGGATAQVLTRGKQVNVPAETVLTFRLDQPWRLQGFSYL